MPSFTLLGQSLVAGVLVGGLYGLLALGLTLSWGLLHLVNIGYFALAFLGAYITYHLGTVYGIAPWYAALLIIPGFFVIGVALHGALARFKVAHLASLLVTFGLIVIVEALIQYIWTADFRRYELHYASHSTRLGPFFIPTLDLIACLAAVALSLLTWSWLRFTYAGRALRAAAEDPEIAAAYGINHRALSLFLAGVCASLAGIAGIFIAMISTLTPSQMWAWFGVVFAVVIIGRLGNPIGALFAGLFIGATESLTMAVISPAWAPLVAFSILIALLLWQPKWL